MTIRVPPVARATAVAAKVARPSAAQPLPIRLRTNSPATIPVTTPCNRRTALMPRSPNEALSAITAATGAKNGC